MQRRNRHLARILRLWSWAHWANPRFGVFRSQAIDNRRVDKNTSVVDIDDSHEASQSCRGSTSSLTAPGPLALLDPASRADGTATGPAP